MHMCARHAARCEGRRRVMRCLPGRRGLGNVGRMAGSPVRPRLLAGVLLFACARGEELTGDSRGPVLMTTTPVVETSTGSMETSVAPG